MRSEAEYTQADALACPHPEYWHARDDQATELEVTELLAGMVRGLQPDLVVETGSYEGDTTIAFGTALVLNGHGHLWSIEYDDERAERVRERVKDLPVTVITGDSLAFEPPGHIDLLFCDSDHGEHRAAEIRHFARWADHRSIVAVHDTAYDVIARSIVGCTRDRIILPPIQFPTPRGLMVSRYAS